MNTKKIHYSNRVNLLVKDEEGNNKFYPRINVKNRVDEIEFIELATRGKGIPTEIFIASLNSFTNTICDIVGNGGTFTTRWLQGHTTMKGSFDSENALFDPESDPSHNVVEVLSFPATVRKKLFSPLFVRFIKEEYYVIEPIIKEVFQLYPYKKDCIRGGSTGRIKGKNLYYSSEDPNSGVFVEDKDGNITGLETNGVNSNQSVYFIVPKDIAVGEYKLKFVSSKIVDGDNISKSHTITIV
ncbi:MAG: DUF4469 domain-containing protein [Hyphomicrobiales bacterium]